jgi:hypothetical protein
MQKNKEDNVVSINHNANEISKESYEKLAIRFKQIVRHADSIIYSIRKNFDEAFTGHENSNPHARKLKNFEVNEKRQEANSYYYEISKDLENEIKALEEGVQKYGIDIRDQEDNSND